MTRFSFFSSLFTFLVVLTLVSCKKDFFSDTASSAAASDRNGGDSTAVLNLQFSTYTLPTGAFLSVQEGRKALACAVSAEMLNNPAFRSALYANLVPNQVRYREVVLGVFQNQVIQTQESGSVVPKTVKTLLNQHLSTLPALANLGDPLGALLDQDKLVSLWFPNDYIYSDNASIFGGFMPVIVSENEEHLLFVGNEMAAIEDPLGIVGMHISEAPVYRLYHAATQTYWPGDIPFEDMHGFAADVCPALETHLNNLPTYGLAPGYRLVHIVDDVYLIHQSANCSGYSMPEVTNFENDPTFSCPRGELESKIKGNFDKHANFLTGIRLPTKAAFDVINNLPCNEWGGNGVSLFRVDWLRAYDGQVQTPARHLYIPVYRSDLFQPIYDFIDVYSSGILVYRIPVLVGHNMRTYYFPESIEIFSKDEYRNHWHPERNGDIVWFDVNVIYPGVCTAVSSNITTWNITVGGEFGFKVLKVVDGKVKFETKYTTQKTVTNTVQAGDKFPLGNAPLEYCAPYPFLSNPSQQSSAKWGWSQSVTTVFCDLIVWAPWYN